MVNDGSSGEKKASPPITQEQGFEVAVQLLALLPVATGKELITAPEVTGEDNELLMTSYSLSTGNRLHIFAWSNAASVWGVHARIESPMPDIVLTFPGVDQLDRDDTLHGMVVPRIIPRLSRVQYREFWPVGDDAEDAESGCFENTCLFAVGENASSRIVSLESHLRHQPDDGVVKTQLEALRAALASEAGASRSGAFTQAHYGELMELLANCGLHNRIPQADAYLIGGRTATQVAVTFPDAIPRPQTLSELLRANMGRAQQFLGRLLMGR